MAPAVVNDPDAVTRTRAALESAPDVVNDPDAVTRTRAALESVVGAGRLVDPGAVTGSEDVGVLAAAGATLLYWLLGGADPAAFAGATTPEQLMRVVAGLPSNHSPQFAPGRGPDPPHRGRGAGGRRHRVARRLTAATAEPSGGPRRPAGSSR